MRAAPAETPKGRRAAGPRGPGVEPRCSPRRAPRARPHPAGEPGPGPRTCPASAARRRARGGGERPGLGGQVGAGERARDSPAGPPGPAFPSPPRPAGPGGAGRGAGRAREEPGAEPGRCGGRVRAELRRPRAQTRPERRRGRDETCTAGRCAGLLSRRAARPWRPRRLWAATRGPEVSAGRRSRGGGGAGRAGRRRVRPGAPQLPRGPRESGSPRPILPRWRGRGQCHSRAGGPGGRRRRTGHGLCSRPGRGHCGGDRRPRPGTLAALAAGRRLLRGRVRVWVRAAPSSTPSARCGDARTCPVKGWPRGGPVSPAPLFRDSAGRGWEPVGNGRFGPVPSLAPPSSVGCAGSRGCSSGSNCTPRPSPGTPWAAEGRLLPLPGRGWGGRQLRAGTRGRSQSRGRAARALCGAVAGEGRGARRTCAGSREEPGGAAPGAGEKPWPRQRGRRAARVEGLKWGKSGAWRRRAPPTCGAGAESGPQAPPGAPGPAAQRGWD